MAAGLLLLACASNPAGQQNTPTQVVHAHYFAERDSAKAARGEGGLVILVRNVDRPDIAIGSALVLLCVGSCPEADTGWPVRAHTDVAGVARIDSLTAGAYQVVVRALGHKPARSSVAIAGGCVGRLEVYLSLFPTSTVPLDLTPARVTHTVCAPDA